MYASSMAVQGISLHLRRSEELGRLKLIPDCKTVHIRALVLALKVLNGQSTRVDIRSPKSKEALGELGANGKLRQALQPFDR